MDDVTRKLLAACQDVLNHVEDSTKAGNGCTLCFTYRKILRDAIDAAYAANPRELRPEDLPF